MEALLNHTIQELSSYKYALDESAIVAITDQKGIITHVNDNFCKISKYSRDELIGKDHRIINSGYHPKTYIKNLWTTIANGQIWKGELKNKAKDGSYYWVDTTIVPFLNDSGKPYQYIAIRADITSMKDEQLQKMILANTITESLIERNNILESIGDAFFALDKNWVVTYWNKTAETILSKTKAEMINRNLWEVFSDAVGSSSYIKYHEALDTNTSRHFEDHYTVLDKWYEVSAYPTGNGLSVYFKDITDRKVAEIQLKALNHSLQKQTRELAISNAELEQFAYVASHDLQEPLRMVTSFLGQIEKKYVNILDQKGKQYIHFAVDGAKRMRQIILDLLEFSRVGRTECGIETVDINLVIEDILALYRKQIEESKADISFTKLPIINTLKVPIRQVFQNLISNSLKYQASGTAPVIRISYGENSNEWIFEVNDNGIGIDSEYFDKIFIIFQRLHNKEDYSGTGMGLAITKKIVENLGGKIWLQSSPGKGSTFYFSILKH